MDKTNFIPRLKNHSVPAFLRPHRFGRSLLVSTLVCYYDRAKVNHFEELFDGAWVGEYPTGEHSRYMVVRYGSSAMVMANDMEGLERNFNPLSYSPVEIVVTRNQDLFQDFQFTIKGSASQMLEEALRYTREHGLPRVYILIDEYNDFTNQLLTAYRDPLYEQMTTKDSFLRIFSKVIKKRQAAI